MIIPTFCTLLAGLIIGGIQKSMKDFILLTIALTLTGIAGFYYAMPW